MSGLKLWKVDESLRPVVRKVLRNNEWLLANGISSS
jgi:hypothetical protein